MDLSIASDEKNRILAELKKLEKTPLNSQRANQLHSKAIKLWEQDGYSGLKSTPNSRWFQAVLDEHSKFPQLMDTE